MALQQTLRALSDPVRREILNLLKSGRLSAGEIGEHFDGLVDTHQCGVDAHVIVLRLAPLHVGIAEVVVATLLVGDVDLLDGGGFIDTLISALCASVFRILLYGAGRIIVFISLC